MREPTENTRARIRIGGKTINNLRYADDTTLLCGNKEDMMELPGRVQELSVKKGLFLNAKKTNIIVLDKNRTDFSKCHLNGRKLEEIKNFVYLGASWLSGTDERSRVRSRGGLNHAPMLCS